VPLSTQVYEWVLCGSRKYPHPHLGGKLKFWRGMMVGGRGARPRNFWRGGGLDSQFFWFPNALQFNMASSFDLALQKSSLTY